MRTVFSLTLIALMLSSAVVSAKIYKWVLPDGSIKYSDKPQESGATEVKLPPLQTYTPAPPPPPRQAAEEVTGAQEEGYEVLEVLAPGHDESIRDNGGEVSVQLAIEPGLRDGHVVEILVDGTAIGSGRATNVRLSELDRGSHTISVTIKNADDEVVASAKPVTFHLLKVSRNSPNFGGPPRAIPQKRAR